MGEERYWIPEDRTKTGVPAVRQNCSGRNISFHPVRRLLRSAGFKSVCIINNIAVNNNDKLWRKGIAGATGGQYHVYGIFDSGEPGIQNSRFKIRRYRDEPCPNRNTVHEKKYYKTSRRIKKTLIFAGETNKLAERTVNSEQ
jgi:hypothetical protein